MKIIHDAWIYCLARASQKGIIYVNEKFDHLNYESDLYNEDEHLHSAIAFLYKHTCMPILLKTRESIDAPDAHLMFTNNSIRIATAHAMCIRVVYTGLPDAYPFIKYRKEVIDEQNIFEKSFLDEATIHSCIVIGM